MPALTTSILIGQYQAIIADEATIAGTLAHRKASSIFCPLGLAPTRAWFLMLKRDLDSLASSTGASSPHTITWTQILDGATSARTFTGFYLANSTRVLHGGEDDVDSLHLVEFVDARGIIAKMSDTDSLNANIRSYAQATDYLDGTEGYTWTSLLTELWNLCPGLGAFPGLPAGFSPDGVPQNTRFIGVSAWHALNAVLDKLDCAVAHNPLAAAANYSIVRLGATQVLAEPTGNLLKWNAEPTDFPVCDIPATVRVYFHNHYEAYGQERDTELTTNWSTVGAGAYVDIATADASALAGTVVALWDDLPRILDEYNTISNASAVNTRATARKDGLLQRQRTTRAHKIYIGVQNFAVGGQVRAVLWRNWGDYDADLGGTVTEYIQRPELVTDYQPGAGGGGSGVGAGVLFITSKAHENYQPLDLARHTYPSYPRLPNIVQVYHSSETAGSLLAANGDGFHPGRVRRWVANAMVTLENCWIRFVDDEDNKSGAVPAIDGECYGPARLSGVSTSGGTLLPVYTVRRGAILEFVEFTLTADMTAGSATATVSEFWDLDPQSPITVYDRQGLFTTAMNGAKGIAVLDTLEDKFIVLECQSKAGRIRGTLNADVATNVSAAATVSDYGGSQQDVQNPGSTADIYDPQDLFKRSLNGAKYLAAYDARSNRYGFIEAQSKAGWIWVSLNADMSGTPKVSSSATVNGYKGTQQDTQNPGSTVDVYGIPDISDNLKSGDKVVALFDNVDNRYYALPKSGTILWARTQDNWDKNSGDARVSCKLTTSRTSTSVSGSAFWVYLPRVNDGDPNVVVDKNIAFFIDANGDAVAVTDYMDDKIGVAKFLARDIAQPEGWAIMDGTANVTGGTSVDARHRFIRAPHVTGDVGTTGGDQNTSNDDGGQKYRHNHQIPCVTGFCGTGITTSSNPEFYAFSGPASGPGQFVWFDDNGTAQTTNATGEIIYTKNIDPTFVYLTPIERLDNAT
jgi:hypothetical protein